MRKSNICFDWFWSNRFDSISFICWENVGRLLTSDRINWRNFFHSFHAAYWLPILFDPKWKYRKLCVFTSWHTIFAIDSIESEICELLNTINRLEVQIGRALLSSNVWKIVSGGRFGIAAIKWVHLHQHLFETLCQSRAEDSVRLCACTAQRKVNGSRENQFVCRRFGATLSSRFTFHIFLSFSLSFLCKICKLILALIEIYICGGTFAWSKPSVGTSIKRCRIQQENVYVVIFNNIQFFAFIKII